MSRNKLAPPAREPNSGQRAGNLREGLANRKRNAVQWSDIPASEVGDFVHVVTGAGCAVILGRTSDGGALSVTVLDGEERVREYPASYEAFSTMAAWLQAMFDTP